MLFPLLARNASSCVSPILVSICYQGLDFFKAKPHTPSVLSSVSSAVAYKDDVIVVAQRWLGLNGAELQGDRA